MNEARPWRRRGTAWIAGLAVLVLLLGAAAAWATLRMRADGTARAAPDLATAPRGPGQVTLDLVPTKGYIAAARVADGTRQALTVQSLQSGTGDPAGYGGQVSAYDPGTFEPAALKAGQSGVVAGRDAWYVPAYEFSGHTDGDGKPYRTPALGWQDPSGVWLLVYADAAAGGGKVFDRAGLQRLADTVLISPPRDLRAPFRLGWTPPGLTLTYISSVDNAGSPGSATVGLSAAGRRPSTAASYPGVPENVDLSISAAGPGKNWTAEKARLSGHTTVAGRPAWLAGRDLVVDAGRCVLRLHTAAERPRADLEHMIKEMLIGDCAQTDGWTPPGG
jgi:hypothetical protein